MKRLVLGSHPVIPRMTEPELGNATDGSRSWPTPGALKPNPGAVVLDPGARTVPAGAY